MIRFMPFLCAILVNADMYLQYPMGSNNRLDDENRDRNNANRLCDTQNNNRGGFNVGNVFYYAGTQVPMKWTAQHSCGNPNNHCEIIIQMMCEDKLRDGTTQSTIPDNPVECYNWDCDTDVRYGRHESFKYYQTCKKTARNKGLFLADQNLKGDAARYTRQNPNGARRGYECPEERDYYPYWRPTPWVDIAYMTNDATVCEEIVKLSQNNMPRQFCEIKEKYLYMKDAISTVLPINQADCEDFKIPLPKMVKVIDDDGNEVIDEETQEAVEVQEGTVDKYVGSWKTDNKNNSPEHERRMRLEKIIGDPACLLNTWSRDNHHGNVLGGDFAGWNWTVPDVEEDNCVLRIRYNISTGDLPHLNENLTTPKLVRDEENENKYYVGMQLGFNMEQIEENGYYFKNNPQVAPFANYTPGGNAFKKDEDHLTFQLAINTAQFGRTFQDRSHRFSIKPKPADIGGKKKIWNLGVRGKRGNIVQTYPGTEYSFQPEKLQVSVGDYVHVQWVGSNTNPNNNAGQGRQGSDRHNIATLANRVYEEAGQPDPVMDQMVYGQLGRSYPAYIGNDENDDDPQQKILSEFLGFSKPFRRKLAILKGVNTNGGELSELDDSGTYADFPPMLVTKAGFYNYLCTRNNNFSNRSQKGTIEVVPKGTQTLSEGISYSGASVTAGGATLTVGAGSITQGLLTFKPLLSQDKGWCGGNCGSGYYEIPNPLPTDAKTTVQIPYGYKADKIPLVFHTTSSSIDSDDWNEVDSAECADEVCTFTAPGKGIYVVSNQVSWWVWLLSIIAVVLVCVGLGFAFKLLRKGA